MPLILTPRAGAGAPGQHAEPIRLNAGTLVIGRGPGVDITLSHPMASARHCTVTGQDLQWQVHDTSSNGTLLNGQRMAGAQTLRSGDVIGIADVAFAVTITDGAGQTTDFTPAPVEAQTAASEWHRAPPSATPVVQASDAQNGTTADAILRTAVTGLIAMAQARRKARQELGAPAETGADSPLLSATSSDAALAHLLAQPPAAATRLIADLLADLDAHQRATLGAMQGSFKAALDQFAPAAIKQSARDDASAWKAYEKAFDAQDGFVELFAQALADNYGRLAGR